MKRTPLKRRTPLAGGSELRRAPLARTRLERRARGPVGDSHGMPWPDVRAVVYARSGGRCEGCGVRLTLEAMEAHHRQTRRHGPDCPGNVLALCGACHHGPTVHGGPRLARRLRRIVSRHEPDPCRVPVGVHVDAHRHTDDPSPYVAWVTLGCDGTSTPATDPDAPPITAPPHRTDTDPTREDHR